MKEKSKNTDAYIDQLEEKIVELSLQLKSKTNELSLVQESNQKSMGKLVHNLKNPVGVIFSFSDMILEGIDDYTSEKLEKHIQIIKKSADFSIQLLNQIAKYTQLDATDFNFTFAPLNYIEILMNISKEFKNIASEKNIIIEKEFPKTPIILMVDKEEISVAIRNILNNALRFSNKNTTITIKVKETSTAIETTITDEGIGISEDDLHAVFNNFHVVNTYSEDKQKCIGLGLSIAKKIVVSHNGKVSATSIFNKGTSITITLPK
ncbi:MAG: hypothetical protein GQ540_09665 [Lutibacter sp.]|uniref:sensor histidine kinase n=1 Tax=Lutibacter sp. TaxID=1925666 RepID=UPI0019E450AF|nr:HAMP domain-containing sensor histidine kinase [Lutibacter sp.]NOR28776.1 hypothetical protein [Lutibacter sp.]